MVGQTCSGVRVDLRAPAVSFHDHHCYVLLLTVEMCPAHFSQGIWEAHVLSHLPHWRLDSHFNFKMKQNNGTSWSEEQGGASPEAEGETRGHWEVATLLGFKDLRGCGAEEPLLVLAPGNLGARAPLEPGLTEHFLTPSPRKVGGGGCCCSPPLRGGPHEPCSRTAFCEALPTDQPTGLCGHHTMGDENPAQHRGPGGPQL